MQIGRYSVTLAVSGKRFLRESSRVLRARIAVARCAALGSLAFGVLLSCRGPTDLIPGSDPDIRPLVVGEAASALGSDGRFLTPSDVPEDSEGTPTISQVQARALAKAFLRSFGPAFASVWTQDRGSPVHVAGLQPSERIFSFRTPFHPITEPTCHPAARRQFGSHYVMTLDSGGEPHVRVSVAAQATDYSVDSSGHLARPPLSGAALDHNGVARDGSWGGLLSPEQAVWIAAKATGTRIASLPVLAYAGWDALGGWYSPTEALWKVVFDREVTVRLASGAHRDVGELYVSPNTPRRFLVPGLEQPATHALGCPAVDENGETHGVVSVDLSVKLGHVTVLEAVQRIIR